MKFRKKPVVIEAVHWLGKYMDPTTWPHWFRDAMSNGIIVQFEGTTTLMIKTLEGHMNAVAGDWIIKGTAGEFYPCKPEIFTQIYTSQWRAS